MADPQNPGQFGNRSDTQEQAERGGEASTGSFEQGSTKASEAGREGNRNQPTEAKQRGGENSGR